MSENADFLFWMGAVGLALAAGEGVSILLFRYGPSWRRSWRSLSLPFRVWLLERRVKRLKRPYAQTKSVPLGSLRFTRSRKDDFLRVPDVHGGGPDARR